MAEHDYNIATLEQDALYNLLPYVVRAGDPGIIRHYFAALATQHNFLAGKLREMPRSQDPTQAASFTPEAVGEDSELFEEWLFLKRLREPSDEQLERITVLDRTVPASIALFAREGAILRALAKTVGEVVSNGLPPFALRPLIRTAIQRHHIRGSHASFHLLGRIMGVFDLKVQELWTRYTLSNPSNPSHPDNDGDFSPVPDQYPYWPASRSVYDGVMLDQWPLGSADYNPFVLDDDPAVKTIIFPHLVTDRGGARFYNSVINGTNPFITISGTVESKLHPGTYTLIGGTTSVRASVSIPYTDGTGQVTFEAVTHGTHGNSVSVTVSDNPAGTQTLTVQGPQSLIKFKSSLFDLVLGVDIDAFYAITAAVPVKAIDEDTIHDTVLGRTPPDYPVTGNVSGSAIISDPEVHYQLDLDVFNDSMTVLQEMVERLRPMSREIRNRRLGLVINDMVRYAPYCALREVILQATDGTLWELYLNEGEPGWQLVESGDAVTVTQFDHGSGNWVEWRISAAGVFSAAVSLSTSPIDQIVFLPGGSRGGFVFVSNGSLRSSGVYDRITDTVHGDGTAGETLLALDYTHFSEPPSSYSTPFMSDDAVYTGGTVPECLNFQPVPEDEVLTRPTILDQDKFHVGAHFGTEAGLDGDINGNWWYNTDGQMHGTDIRLRSAGINTGPIEPIITGDGSDEDGLRYGYPVQFLNYHGVYVYRDRLGNVPKYAAYSYEAPNANTGCTMNTTPLYEVLDDGDGDGHIEGGETPLDWEPLEAMVGETWDEDTVSPWNRYVNWEFTPVGLFTSISSASGKAQVNGLDTSLMYPGGQIKLEPAYGAAVPHTIMTPGTDTVLTTAFGSSAGAGRAWVYNHPAKAEGIEQFQFSITTDEDQTGTTDWVLWRSVEGAPLILDSGSLAPGGAYQATYDIHADEIWLETTGDLSGSAELQFLTYPPELLRDGYFMAGGGERDDLLYFLHDAGEYWWEHDEGGIAPVTPLTGGELWWRGGTVYGERSGTYVSRGAEMPAELVLVFS